MIIGLLMVSHENDVLAEVMAANAPLVDGFYALDGTIPNLESKRLLEGLPGCWGYMHDIEISHDPPRDGWRGRLLEQAYVDHGHDHWFVLLHGDEVWTANPRAMVERYGHLADGLMFLLPMYFPHEIDGWEDSVAPLAQLRWHLGPGYPELRMFKGGPDVHYDPEQHHRVQPEGCHRLLVTPAVIRHYLFRAPAEQVARAQRHRANGFDPSNYAHIGDDGTGTLWGQDLIDARLLPHAYEWVGCDR